MGPILLLLSLFEYFATRFRYRPLNTQSRLLSRYINKEIANESLLFFTTVWLERTVSLQKLYFPDAL